MAVTISGCNSQGCAPWNSFRSIWVGGMAGVLAAGGRWLLRRAHPDILYGYALVSLAILAIAPVVIACAGIVRPLILLPPAALAGWSPEQVEMALLHELAHVRRWDNLVNLIQRIVEAALFFQPAVWIVSGWVRREREHCCDRIVTGYIGRGSEYARALLALAETTSTPIIHGAYMARARNHLVDRVRSILTPEDHTMRLSRSTVGVATALLFVPVVLAAALAEKANSELPLPQTKTANRASNEAESGAVEQPQESAPGQSGSVTNRQLNRSGMTKAARRRDNGDRPWQPGPIPATITVDVAGVAKDESGSAIHGATITLYSITEQGSKAAGTATTDAQGVYSIRAATIPVWSSNRGHPLPKEITPYADFILSGLAPGFGIAWSPQQGMYALKEPNPKDIQGRLPLGQPSYLT